MSRDVRALDAQDLARCIRELADILESETWAEQRLTGAFVGAALRKATEIGSRRAGVLSTAFRVVIRRNLRRARLEAEAHMS